MPGESYSANMNMPLPGVGVTAGPQYATDINSSLTIVDQHDHSSGKGVQVTPAGLDINADLPMASNNITQLRSARFTVQTIPLAAAADLGCVYISGADLYYNDTAGNQVRITQSGNVAGTPGSIGSLSSPASATYVSVSQTFVWQSDANTPANMDMAGLILRNLSASSKGLTISPPNSMAADYAIVLPALPASQKIMTLDASGNMTAPYALDNSSLEVSSNTIRVKAAGITQAMEANVIQSKTADYTVVITDSIILVDTALGNVVITLPTAIGNRNHYVIKKTSSDGYVVNIATTAGQTIDGAASATPQLSAINDSLTVQSDNANYVVASSYRNPLRASYTLPSDQTIPNSTDTQVVLTSASGSNAVTFNGNGSMTVKYAGFYNIVGNLLYAANAAGDRYLYITLNGTIINGQTISGVGNANNFLSASVTSLQLAAGDIIAMTTRQFSAGNLDLKATSPKNNSLTISRVGVIGDV